MIAPQKSKYVDFNAVLISFLEMPSGPRYREKSTKYGLIIASCEREDLRLMFRTGQLAWAARLTLPRAVTKIAKLNVVGDEYRGQKNQPEGEKF